MLATARDASGGDAWNQVAEIVTQGTLKVGTNTGSLSYLEDLRTGRNVLHYQFPSGSKGAQGTDISRTWQQDSSGYISISNDADSQKDAADDLYLARRAFWQPNFGGAAVTALPDGSAEQAGYDRVEVHPKGGRGLILWINRQTHLIERVEHEGGHPYTEFWSDYREVELPSGNAAVRMPFKISIGNGTQQMLYTTRKILEKTKEPDFAIPFRRDYALPKEGKVTVPFFSSTGIILKAKINGKGPFAVILDSGAEINLLSTDLARQLGLKTEHRGSLAGLAGTVKTQNTSVESVQIGGLVLRNQQFLALDVPYSLKHSWKEPIVAAIGYSAFRELAIQIDYQQHQVTFYDGPSFRYAGKGTEVPMRVSNGWLVADGTVAGVPGTFSLDTGQANVTLTLFRSFLNRTNLGKAMGERFCGASGESFGGVEHACFTRCKALTLGSTEAHDLVTQLSLDSKGICGRKQPGRQHWDRLFPQVHGYL
jgi:predicted aspartyl protease